MAKAPVAGTVKTRLEPFIAPEKCAGIAAAFLRDAESKAESVCRNTILAYAPADEKKVFESFLRGKSILVEQTGATLGERMSNAFEFAFARGSNAVVMIGTDSPTFPAEFILRAFDYLETNADVALGKTADGGFYLIGMKKNHAKIFENVAWSSASVFEQTAKNVERLGLRLAQIPAWYDVDTPDDLFFLRDEFFADEKARQIAPETFQWLKSNAEIFANGLTIGNS